MANTMANTTAKTTAKTLITTAFISLIGMIISITLPLMAADTLLIADGEGQYKAGVATTWHEEAGKTIFVLEAAADGEDIAELLADRLFNSTATFDPATHTLTVSGLPHKALLSQLTSLSLTDDEDDDPLGDLAGLGGTGATAMAAPEAGGSIRASKPSAIPMPYTIAEHDKAERIWVRVIAVEKGEFPQVTLKVRIKKGPKTGAYKKVLKRGKVLTGPMRFTTDVDGTDYRAAANHNNIMAYYLQKGDKVVLHPIAGADEKSVEFDFIARK